MPYSLIGPFAGVFIDRWSRRQIIVYGALIRAVMVAVAGFVVLSGQTGVPLYVSALAVLGVNRFFLSAVSAGTPRIVHDDELVMANAVAPTSGTIVGFVGGVVGLGVHLITGGGLAGSAATLVVRRRSATSRPACSVPGWRKTCSARAPASGRRQATARLPATWGTSRRGWSAGLRHLNQKRRAALRPRRGRRPPRPVRHAAR